MATWKPIEDYALLSDQSTAALVAKNGSIDWLCLPHFDSGALFSALLGTRRDGRWKLSVSDGEFVSRRYVGSTFILETVWRSPSGTARVLDFMSPSNDTAELIRRVECLSGSVDVANELNIRFNYGSVAPWFRPCIVPGAGTEQGLLCTGGADGILITGPALGTESASDEDLDDPASGGVYEQIAGIHHLSAGERADWTLTWFRPWEDVPTSADVDRAFADAEDFWGDWVDRLDFVGAAQPVVERSLLVLKALTHERMGGIVAAATTSLPEAFGGGRNWDYRYTWLRDAALTVEVMVSHGLIKGATGWRNWLLRAVAGDPAQLQIMYGIDGRRELPEAELGHLRGYRDSRPVRIGNNAAAQYQADVTGEVMHALAALRDAGYADSPYTWGLQVGLLNYTIAHFHDKDHGIWEMRGERQYFTHGRVMMWSAFNDAVRAVEQYGYAGDVDLWREYRDRLREEILTQGWDPQRKTFTQVYGGTEVDASLLQIPHTGFLAPDDPRMLSTVAAIEEDLVDDSGLVYRYRAETGVDGLDGIEYPFIMCAFWLVEQHARTGRLEEAERRFDMLCGLANDLGLLAEEYDPTSGRLAGNFPQAFSHLSLIRAADAIAEERQARETR